MFALQVAEQQHVFGLDCVRDVKSSLKDDVCRVIVAGSGALLKAVGHVTCKEAFASDVSTIAGFRPDLDGQLRLGVVLFGASTRFYILGGSSEPMPETLAGEEKNEAHQNGRQGYHYTHTRHRPLSKRSVLMTSLTSLISGQVLKSSTRITPLTPYQLISVIHRSVGPVEQR